jgi:hypothetical protein
MRLLPGSGVCLREQGREKEACMPRWLPLILVPLLGFFLLHPVVSSADEDDWHYPSYGKEEEQWETLWEHEYEARKKALEHEYEARKKALEREYEDRKKAHERAREARKKAAEYEGEQWKKAQEWEREAD